MRSELKHPDEGLSTHVTFERPLSRVVSPDVFLQLGLGPEVFVTSGLGALERLLSSVDQFVSGDGRRREHLAAVRTRMAEALVKVLHPPVPHQSPFLLEGPLAVRAGIFLLLRKLTVYKIQMPQQVGLMAELLPTLGAEEGLLSGVDS